jgi:hypothetical protein
VARQNEAVVTCETMLRLAKAVEPSIDGDVCGVSNRQAADR